MSMIYEVAPAHRTVDSVDRECMVLSNGQEVSLSEVILILDVPITSRRFSS